MIILKTFLFFRFDGKSFAKHLEESVCSRRKCGKTIELFDISTIVYGQGNVLRTIYRARKYTVWLSRKCAYLHQENSS